jgi:heme/copper-type cytochrome/quinol oxidase subunit 2
LEEGYFSSYMKRLDDLTLGETRFLEVDNRLVFPQGSVIQVNITRRDVIHSFALPTLGVKADATAGLLNVLSFDCEKIGVHSGQCREICGINHRYIPIVVERTRHTLFFY